MAFFDFLDSRKSLAKWAAKTFRQFQNQSPKPSVQDIIDVALAARYHVVKPKPHQAEILIRGRVHATDIHSFCYLIADAELLSHLSFADKTTMKVGDTNIVNHTYGIIDAELARLGFPRNAFA